MGDIRNDRAYVCVLLLGAFLTTDLIAGSLTAASATSELLKLPELYDAQQQTDDVCTHAEKDPQQAFAMVPLAQPR